MGGALPEKDNRRKIKHRFFVPPSRFQRRAGGPVVAAVDPETAHYLRTVLRLSLGAKVILFDNSGREYVGEIIESKANGVKVAVLAESAPAIESPLAITLAQALLKGNAFDHLLTLATELGLSRFIPLVTARTVVKIRAAEAEDRVRRWEKIAAAASAQSGRVRVPRVESPQGLDGFLAREEAGAKIILWERGGRGQLKEIAAAGEPVILLAGPEGGFADAEVEKAQAAGYRVWGLGSRILRAENAGAIAISLVQYERGDMG